MRKKICLSILLLILFILIPISVYSQIPDPVAELVNKMPDSVKILAYTTPKRFADNAYLNQFLDGENEAFFEAFTKTTDLLIGVSEIADKDEPETMVVYIRGKHLFDDIYNLMTTTGKEFEMTNIMNTPTMYIEGEFSMMSISPDLTAVTLQGQEGKVIEAAKHNANTIDKNSKLYRLTQNLKNYNLGWITGDIDYFGEIDLNQLNIPSLKGSVTPKTIVISSLETTDKIRTFISVDVDNAETASTIAPVINFMIPLVYSQFGQMLPISDTTLKKEITNFVKGIQLQAKGSNIESTIVIRKALVKSLGEIAISGAENALGSAEPYYGDEGYVEPYDEPYSEDGKYEPYYDEDGYDAKEEYKEPFEEDKDNTSTEPGLVIEDEDTYAEKREKTEEDEVLTYDKKTISANEVIQKINTGEHVYYKDVVVEGELNFIKIQNIARTSENVYTSYVSPSVTFVGCVFNDGIRAYLETNEGQEVYYTMFQKNVSFIDCVFNKKIDLSSARFENRADFSNSLFQEEANFNNTDFEGDVNFKDATFEDISTYYWAQFASKALFDDANFKKLANFKEASFSEYANFKGAIFEDKANFNEVNFKESANFSESNFYEKAYFNNVLFLTKALFKNTVFEDKANFEWSSFNGQANFTNSTFKDDANFGKAIFKDDAYFGKVGFRFSKESEKKINEGNTKFLNGAYFGSTLFSGSAYFSGIEMKGEAYFYGSRFVGYADFRNIDFNGEANFGLTQFNTDAYFASCTFKDTANFEEALFTSKAYFENSIFKSNAMFSKAQFTGYAYFPNAVFESEAQFRNTQYLGHAFFKYAVFVSEADFYKAYFIGTVDFTGVEFKSEASFKGSVHNEKAFDPTK